MPGCEAAVSGLWESSVEGDWKGEVDSAEEKMNGSSVTESEPGVGVPDGKGTRSDGLRGVKVAGLLGAASEENEPDGVSFFDETVDIPPTSPCGSLFASFSSASASRCENGPRGSDEPPSEPGAPEASGGGGLPPPAEVGGVPTEKAVELSGLIARPPEPESGENDLVVSRFGDLLAFAYADCDNGEACCCACCSRQAWSETPGGTTGDDQPEPAWAS